MCHWGILGSAVSYLMHESEQTLGDDEGRGSLTCCHPWGRKEADTAERLNSKSCKRDSPVKDALQRPWQLGGCIFLVSKVVASPPRSQSRCHSPNCSGVGFSSGIQCQVRGSAGHPDTQTSWIELLAEPLGTLLTDSALLNFLF